MKKLNFQGIHLPVTTPFTSSGRIDFRALTANIERYRDTGISGFLAAGSTGEGVHLETGERLEVVDCVLEAAGDRPVTAGIQCASLKQAVNLLRRMESRCLRGILVSVPSYYKNRMNAYSLETFFRNLGEESSFPLLLYNFPRVTGIELASEMVGSLAALPAFTGMKDSSGNLVYQQKVLEETSEYEFEILSGNAETYGFSRLLGIRAAVLAVGCVVPELTARLSTIQIDEIDEFRRLQRRIYRLSALVVGRLGVPGVKYAMNLRGFHGGFCREPLLPLSLAEQAEVEQVLNQVLDDE